MEFILGRIFGQSFRFMSNRSFTESFSKLQTNVRNAMIRDLDPYRSRDIKVEQVEEGEAYFTITLKASYAKVGIYGWIIAEGQNNSLVKGYSFIAPEIVLFYLSTIPVGIVVIVVGIITQNLLFLAGGIGGMLAGLGYYVRFVKSPLQTLVAILEEEIRL